MKTTRTHNRCYVAQFWRNDGDWHDSGYDRMPVIAFYAKNDAEANHLAANYIAANRMSDEDFSLTHLARVEITVKSSAVKNKVREQTYVLQRDLKPLEKKLERAKLRGLNDLIKDCVFPEE